MANHTTNWAHYSSYHVYRHLTIYFSSPVGHYTTFHTQASFGRNKIFSIPKNCICFFVLQLTRCVYAAILKSDSFVDQNYGPKTPFTFHMGCTKLVRRTWP